MTIDNKQDTGKDVDDKDLTRHLMSSKPGSNVQRRMASFLRFWTVMCAEDKMNEKPKPDSTRSNT